MVGLVVLFLANLPPAASGNLLNNPSFELRMADGRPRSWSSFVLPQPGAFADLDALAHTGQWSAMIHNPEPYAKEAANNWSQIILHDVAGKELVLGGWIRTEAVTEAALWLQCFQERPTQVVAAQTSSSAKLISGTNGWEHAEVLLTAPETTDFVVVRCVIKGQGTAWFDDISLQVAPKAEPNLEPIEPEEAAPAEQEPQEKLSKADLVQLSRMLQHSIKELEASNKDLLQRIEAIQKDMEATRAKLPPPLEPLDHGRIRHPLVPHGYEQRENAP